MFENHLHVEKFICTLIMPLYAYMFSQFILYTSGFQPFWWSRSPRLYSSGMKNPFSHICTGELKYTVDPSICITSGGTPGLCWQNPRVPGNPGLKTTAVYSNYTCVAQQPPVSLHRIASNTAMLLSVGLSKGDLVNL